MMVGGVLCVPGVGAPAPHPLFFVVLFCLFCYAGAGLCAGLWGVVDVGDELLCFVDQGGAEESGTRQQHQPPVRDRSRT